MKIADFLSQWTGRPVTDLFSAEPLVAVVFDGNGVPSLARWSPSLGVAPTAADLAAAIAAPDPAPGPAQLNAWAAAKVPGLLALMRTYAAAGATLKSDATPATLSDLLALITWGEANPTASQNWVANDLTVTPITGAQFVALAVEVGTYAQSVYAALATVLGEIEAGTIAAFAAIDAFAWPV